MRDAPMMEDASAGRSPLGAWLLLGGVVLLFLRGVEGQTGIPGMPRFWYRHEELWWLLAAASVAGGCWINWTTSEVETKRTPWRPTRRGFRFQSAVLFTKDDCPLCEQMRAELHRYSAWIPEPELVSIEHDPDLARQHGEWVPVLQLDGKIRFRGRLNEPLLQRLIEGASQAADNPATPQG